VRDARYVRLISWIPRCGSEQVQRIMSPNFVFKLSLVPKTSVCYCMPLTSCWRERGWEGGGVHFLVHVCVQGGVRVSVSTSMSMSYVIAHV
jgi:hypothetical protein